MTEQEEHIRRQRRKDSYHLAAGKNKLPSDPDESDYVLDFLTQPPSAKTGLNDPKKIQQAKTDLIRELAISGGDVETPRFNEALEQLTKLYDSHYDANNKKNKLLSGMWLTLSKPKYKDCLGRNQDNDYMYSLGRMCFDMFSPTSLVCSIQGTFNPIHYVSQKDRQAIERVPKSLQEELKQGKTVLRTYDIVTACTIESSDTTLVDRDAPNRIVPRPIQALMTTYGYALPNPNQQGCVSIWFTGGSLEIIDSVDLHIWKVLFGDNHGKHRPMQERAKLFGARLAVGATPPKTMEADGKMSFTLNRPVGGHGVAHADILYLDDTLRVIRTSGGEVNVFARVPSFPDE